MTPLLLAELTVTETLTNGLRYGRWPLSYQWGAIATGVAVALCLAAWLAARYLPRRERVKINSPAKLLLELFAAHGLRYRQRQLIVRLAKHHQLTQPAVLFVEPALWSAERLGARWDRMRSELDALRDQLFAP
jgi:hypothetical protein